MKEEIRIERADVTCIGEIRELEELCFATPWSIEALYEDICVNKNSYFVLKADGKIVAYGGMWIIIDEAHITNICVHPDYRARGFGQKLMQHMIRYARSQGVEGMTLEVRVSNAPALHMYNKLGFKLAGRRKKYYSDTGEDAYIMWKQDFV